MKYSRYQENIFDFAINSEKNAVVEATAGSGKTMTIVETANRMNGLCENPLFLAFNKSIATELQYRLPIGFEARTMHSLGFRALMYSAGSINIDAKKMGRLIKQLLDAKELTWPENKDRPMIQQLVGLSKSHLLTPDSDRGEFIKLIKHYEISPVEMDNDRLIEVAIKLLDRSLNETKVIDFDDMIYQPLIFNRDFPQHDFLFVDEAQDLNLSQHELLRRVLGTDGRIIAVGDSRQAIYGWRGANSDSLLTVGKMFNCEILPLSISYRCPKKVIAMAQTIVPEIEAAEWAEDGEVNYPNEINKKTFSPNDMILCRANAPLLAMAYRCIRMDIPVQIVGRNIGKELVKLIGSLKADDVSDLETNLAVWETNKIEHHVKRDEFRSVNHIKDRADTVRVFIDNMRSSSISEITSKINNMFGEARKDFVNLSTVHRAKGLEADNVFILPNSSWFKSSDQGNSWRAQEERNIDYVAWTRAKKTLSFLKEKQ